jgi:Photosynthetic reaction centre cytochrome C subunit
LRLSSLKLSTAAVALMTAALAVAQTVQTPPPPQQAGGAPPAPRTFPAPTNLKVLPKNLTGQQVHDIMEGWEAALGAHCNTCHTPDPNNIGPNGRPRLNFADDTKPEKSTARMMFKMVDDINTNYVSKVDNSGVAVTCGTCHRGHIGPEPFVAPPEEEHGPPPAGEKPPIPK